MLFNFAGGGCKYGHVYILKIFQRCNNFVIPEFRGDVRGVAADYSGNLKIDCCLQRFNGVLTDVAVTNDGCSDFFHFIRC